MGYKILLADDSVTVQKIITLTFSDEGVDVLTVNNGDEAVNRLQYLRPALVMADVSIPGKNGYEICEFVKNHPEMKNTPVVLLVPAFEPFDEERARRLGADQHLTKPFQSIRTLITTVKTLLEAHPPRFSTGSLNSGYLAQPVEQPKAQAAVAEAVPVAEAKTPIRETQPFPSEERPEEPEAAPSEPSTDAVAEGDSPDIAEDVIVDIWKDDVGINIWKDEEPSGAEQVEPQADVESIIEFEEAQEEILFTESAAEPEAEPVIEEELPEAQPMAEPVPATDTITDSITEPNVKVLGDAAAQGAESTLPVEMPAPTPAAPQALSGDLDHVLDLDDVLTWPPAPMPEPQLEAPQVLVPSAPSFTPTETETTIPQSVIDEIVNRVVAQLSEKLPEKLAAQLAPEVAELVKRQTQQEMAVIPPALKESDSLLDLD